MKKQATIPGATTTQMQCLVVTHTKMLLTTQMLLIRKVADQVCHPLFKHLI